MNKNNQNILIFCVITLLSGWLGYLVDQNIGPQSGEETPGMGLWLVLPLLTSFILRFIEKDWTGFGLNPRIATNGKWYIIALLIFPVVTLLVTVAGMALGWVDASSFNANVYFTGVAVTLLPNFIKNIFEEFVWRGYLANKLIKAKYSDGFIYLVVGAVWGAWHIPYYLFFLPDSTILQILPVERLTFALIAVITMICWTVMYVELYRITQSIWPVVILHMVEDSVVNHLLTDRHIVIMPGKEIFISPILGIVTSLLYLCIGLILRKKRKAANSMLYEV